MSQSRRRRVDHLEEKLGSYFEAIRKSVAPILPAEFEAAMIHAINLSTLVLYGNPAIGEPLSTAWQRCVEKVPDIQVYETGISPFNRWGARVIALLTNEKMFLRLPSAAENKKIAAMLASAPPWLIWFTHGDLTADVLGVKSPDLSSVTRFARPKITNRWPAFPNGKFERQPWPDGSDVEPISPSEREFLRTAILGLDNHATPRERKRALRIYVTMPKAKSK